MRSNQPCLPFGFDDCTEPENCNINGNFNCAASNSNIRNVRKNGGGGASTIDSSKNLPAIRNPPCMPTGFDDSSSDESLNNYLNGNINSNARNLSVDEGTGLEHQIEALVERNMDEERSPNYSNRLNQPIIHIENSPTMQTVFNDRSKSQLLNNRDTSGIDNQKNNLVMNTNTDNENGPPNYSHPDLLPKKSIIYDYIFQPIGIQEQSREFLPMVGNLSSPFLRPILIDGIGLIKAYWEGCSEEDADGASMDCFDRGTKFFPFVPIIRCLFYWISRGHLAQLHFPSNLNPICYPGKFGANEQQITYLKLLARLKIICFPQGEEYRSLISEKQKSMRACIITSIHNWISANKMDLDLNDSDEYRTWNEVYKTTTSDHILQPYFGPQGDFVYFAPIRGAVKEFTFDTVLDNEIKTQQQFVQYYQFQLEFIKQAKQLKALFDLLPSDKRLRETQVMTALLKRLDRFL